MNTVMTLPTFLPDEVCWQAVLDRDEQYDGRFFTAVRSTRIYCRPSCPSRHPGRAQVTFYFTRTEAEQAGYRPCLRCHPERELTKRAELVQQAIDLLQSAEVPPTLEELGERLGASPYHLQRVFKAATGLSPRQYAAGLRADRFKEEVRKGRSVTHALYEAGYGAPSRLYEDTPSRLGMTPGAYRSGGKTMQIHYTIVDCPLGRLLVAATPQGVCAVSLGGQDAALAAALQAEYPAAQLHLDQSGLQREVEILLEYLHGRTPRPDLPLDVQATAFQLRVWEELRRIPCGETRTYAQVAVAIGNPRAVRAVASACASNPAALINPCHRVVRTDGGLGGYRWGIERKQALLTEEHARGAA
jgi:AraC family transcriptional regulator, regulatory protein of adaptative response / methylated-DNA-[protein]-cysteine methyltransferase